jgi:hypothetical protein
MRRILVENARRKHRLKHGGKIERVKLHESQVAAPESPSEILAVDEALGCLEQTDAIVTPYTASTSTVTVALEAAARAASTTRPSRPVTPWLGGRRSGRIG